MDEDQYLSVINAFETDAIQYNRIFNVENEELQRRYKGDPYGDELPERSKIISNDVQDVVEADMPSLARTFLGASKICVFEAQTEDPKEIEEAKEKTEYIDWIVRGQEDSFRVQFGFLKDVDIQKLGALKFFMEDIVEKRIVSHEDISFEELAELEESLDGEDVESIEIVTRSEIRGEPPIDGQPDNQRLDVEFEVTRNTRRARVMGIPLESFIISTNAVDEESANLVGDRVKLSRGELLQEGHSMETVISLPTAAATSSQESTTTDSTLAQIRFDDNGDVSKESFSAWATQMVEITDMVVKIDKDGDGVAERRHIVKSGDVILEDEPFEVVPYAITSAILMPHTAIGISRAELAAPTARIKTALIRGIADNSYGHNAPQMGVNENVNQDDLLTKRPNGIVRVEGKENPGNSLFPINIEYIGDKALQVVQYFDNARAQTTGTLLASQGLQGDTFEKETATRFTGVQEKGAEKIELVVRVIAETAYKRLYNGLAWLVSQYQTTEVEIKVLGKPLTVNPANWKHKHLATSTIGLGAGDGERTTETTSAILSLQRQLKAEGSVLVDDVKIYNSIDSMLKTLDIHNTAEFFNNPEVPDQLLKAQNEILTSTVQQLQQILEQSQNPLAEAETIKAQAQANTNQTRAQVSLITANSKAQLDAAKLRQSGQQFNQEQALKQRQGDQKIAVELTKIEANTDKNVPGSLI
ncbi:MAG: hypothetical protein O7D95_06545 [Betaproteobacteria bacterium]|nr:hypothetical protein [Betaproteobacteria bacterium]